MQKGTKPFGILKALSWLTQLGLSLIAPPLLSVFIALKIQERFGLGTWVLPVAIAVGLLTSVCSFISFAKQALRDADSEKEETEDET